MTVATQTANDIMHARKSVRKYKEGVVIPREELLALISDATSAPSASNLQPWRFLIVDDAEVKKELFAIAYNQEQVQTASAVIAVLADVDMYEKSADIYNQNVEEGFMPRDVADSMIINSTNMYGGLPLEVRKNLVHFDTGLISMQLMLLAKERGYDTVPMAGFDKVKFAARFELAANEMPVLLLPIGEAAAPAHGSSRLKAEQLTRFI
ncbi:MAG: nitroreductase family protein [Solibacillus sp.]